MINNITPSNNQPHVNEAIQKQFPLQIEHKNASWNATFKGIRRTPLKQ